MKDGVFFLFLACVVCLSLLGPHKLHGDGREYVLQTQAIVFQNSLAIEPEVVGEYWNSNNPYGVELSKTRPAGKLTGPESQAGGGFGGLYPDKQGRYRYYHHWLYSLSVAPVYAILHSISPSGTLEYLSFRIFNVILLAGFLLLFWQKARSYPKLILCSLMILSPLIPYAEWQHPEIFCLFLGFLSFRLATSLRWGWASPLVLGLAASQNVPMVFFFPVLLGMRLVLNRPSGTREWSAVVSAYAGGIVLASSSMLYFYSFFGAANVIAKVGLASFEYASLPRTWLMLASPITGALWLYPACFFFLPLCIRRRDTFLLLSGGACLVAAAWLCTATANFNGGQVGALRYSVWLMAPLWYLLSARTPTSLCSRTERVVFGCGMACTLSLVVHFRLTHLPSKNLSRFHGCCRAMPEVAMLVRALPYNDDVETLVENIRGTELGRPVDFSGIYIWELDRDLFLWVVSHRAWKQVKYLEWSHGEEKHAIDIESAEFRRHPVLGEYALFRTKGRMDAVHCDWPVTIRARSVTQKK